MTPVTGVDRQTAWARLGAMRSGALRSTVIGLVLLLVSAAGGYGIASVLDDDGAPSSTATTDSSTTTVPGDAPAGPTGPQPPDGQSIIVSGSLVLGWWDGDSWVRNDGPAAPLVAGLGFTYTPLEGGLVTAIGGAPITACGIPEDLPGVELDPAPTEEHRVAVTGVARPLPRRVEPLDRASATYRTAAAEALATVGIDDDAPELTQLYRVDLDGDGSDEVLITAHRRSNAELADAEPGDYSAVLVRRIDGGGVETQVVAHSLAEGPDDDDDDDGDDDGGLAFRYDHRIDAVADLNGDGTLEVVVDSPYYEGSGTTVHAVASGGQLDEVLAATCGP